MAIKAISQGTWGGVILTLSSKYPKGILVYIYSYKYHFNLLV